MNDFGMIIDLDGTLIHKGKATGGAIELVEYLKNNNVPYRIITNSVGRTKRELSDKAKIVGLSIEENLFFNPIVALDILK